MEEKLLEALVSQTCENWKGSTNYKNWDKIALVIIYALEKIQQMAEAV